jgi:hypothetical protein
MWASSVDTNQVIKLSSSCSPTYYSAPGGPVGIVFDGTNLWTANVTNSTISRINLSGTVTGSYTVGYQPWWIAYDGANVWATDFAVGKVSKMSTSSPGSNPPSYQTCGSATSHPLGLAFDGAQMWVGCQGNNQLGKM